MSSSLFFFVANCLFFINGCSGAKRIRDAAGEEMTGEVGACSCMRVYVHMYEQEESLIHGVRGGGDPTRRRMLDGLGWVCLTSRHVTLLGDGEVCGGRSLDITDTVLQ